MAETLRNGLEGVGFNVVVTNPFIKLNKPSFIGDYNSPHVARLHAMWDRFRRVVLKHVSSPPGIPRKSLEYMKKISENYRQDAYNSLSIEGYRVTEELIDQVKRREWSPDQKTSDKELHNALVARGYYETFLEVKQSVQRILQKELPGLVVTEDLQKWYQKLFSPLAQVGIVSLGDLFGYRRSRVYIRNSRHIPPAKEHVKECMEALFLLLQQEEHAAVRAILGHFFFVYIHPYMDGNGRIGRFLMNAMFASGGYPWTVIRVEHRDQYIAALEKASCEEDILAFVKFICSSQKAFEVQVS